jgi:superoxide dismutase, Fe-Mn family
MNFGGYIMAKNKGRRDFLKTSALGVASLGVAGSGIAGNPVLAKDSPITTGSNLEYRFQAKPLKESTLRMEGISRKTMEEHFKLYQGYVNKSNEILDLLKQADPGKGNQIFSDIRVLKQELTFAIGGVKNHEIYFDHLGGNGGKPDGQLLADIEKNFGSFDSWAADLKGTGLAARGWVWLAYDHDTGTLFNYLGDAQNTFPIWNATIILALDTYEHAYFIDYAVNRGAYIDAFIKNLDWSVVENTYFTIPKDK